MFPETPIIPSAYPPPRIRKPETEKLYSVHFAPFERWCEREGIAPEMRAKHDTMMAYLYTRLRGGLSVHTCACAYSAIAAKLRARDPALELPVKPIGQLLRLCKGIPARAWAPKRGVTQAQIELMTHPARFDATRWAESARDRALLLLGFHARMSCTELAQLEVSDLAFDAGSASVHIPSRGARVTVPRAHEAALCPIHALEIYLRGMHVESGAVFVGTSKRKRIHADTAKRILRDACASIGLHPQSYGSQSLQRRR